MSINIFVFFFFSIFWLIFSIISRVKFSRRKKRLEVGRSDRKQRVKRHEGQNFQIGRSCVRRRGGESNRSGAKRRNDNPSASHLDRHEFAARPVDRPQKGWRKISNRNWRRRVFFFRRLPLGAGRSVMLRSRRLFLMVNLTDFYLL